MGEALDRLQSQTSANRRPIYLFREPRASASSTKVCTPPMPSSRTRRSFVALSLFVLTIVMVPVKGFRFTAAGRRTLSALSSSASTPPASPPSLVNYITAGPQQYVTAPMVAQSDFAFRQLTRNHGATLTYTQMLHARNFVSSKSFRSDNYDFNTEMEGLKYGNPPLIAQIAGDDVGYMTEAATILSESGVDGIDINLGCPQAIAKKGNYGAFLLPQTDITTEIVKSIKRNVPNTPLTAKIRIQEKIEDTLMIARKLEEVRKCEDRTTTTRNTSLAPVSNPIPMLALASLNPKTKS